jgi:Cu2+-containing amine oxidase
MLACLHFFCFRLDFDIDEAQNNAVLELNTESAKPGKDREANGFQ